MVHVSLGMTTRAEEQQVVAFFEQTTRRREIASTSTRAHRATQCRSKMSACSRSTDSTSSSAIESPACAFSGHHLGIAADIAAYALGARWVETTLHQGPAPGRARIMLPRSSQPA